MSNPHNDEKFYEVVAAELDEGNIKQGLWLKAETQSAGDKDKARLLYIQWRVEQLSAENPEREDIGSSDSIHEVAPKESISSLTDEDEVNTDKDDFVPSKLFCKQNLILFLVIALFAACQFIAFGKPSLPFLIGGSLGYAAFPFLFAVVVKWIIPPFGRMSNSHFLTVVGIALILRIFLDLAVPPSWVVDDEESPYIYDIPQASESRFQEPPNSIVPKKAFPPGKYSSADGLYSLAFIDTGKVLARGEGFGGFRDYEIKEDKIIVKQLIWPTPERWEGSVGKYAREQGLRDLPAYPEDYTFKIKSDGSGLLFQPWRPDGGMLLTPQ